MEDGAKPEVEQEVISKYEQEPEFRDFIKNLLRCRSLASLDDKKEAKREEEEKTARTEKKTDDIEPRIVGGGRSLEKRRNHQALLSEGGRTEERSGRGEHRDGRLSQVSQASVTTHNLQLRFTIKFHPAVNLEILSANTHSSLSA